MLDRVTFLLPAAAKALVGNMASMESIANKTEKCLFIECFSLAEL
jgi:hypothetical protein